jgi:hypothetical protein
MTNFLKDSPYSHIIRTELQQEHLHQGLQFVQLILDGYTTEIPDKARQYNEQYYYDKNAETPTNKDSNKFRIMKKHLTTFLGDFGNGRKGFPLGLVSTSLELEYDDKKRINKFKKNWENKNCPTYPNREHFFPIEFQATLIIEDYINGHWKFNRLPNGELDGMKKGQRYIEWNYPYYHHIVWVTREENLRLIEAINRITLEEISPSTNIPNMEKIKERIRNSEHYKMANITFYTDIIDINGERSYDKLIDESFRKLQTGKKVKIKRLSDEFWV